MATYNISYEAYPTSEAATEHSRTRAQLGFALGGLSFFLCFAATVYYAMGIIFLIDERNYGMFLNSMGAFWIASMAAYYFVVIFEENTSTQCDLLVLKDVAKLPGVNPEEIKAIRKSIKSRHRDCQKKNVKAFFVGLCPTFLGLTGVIGCIKSIHKLIHESKGVLELVISFVLAGAVVMYLVLRYGAKKDEKTPSDDRQGDSVQTVSDGENETGKTSVCIECGSEIAAGSKFCLNCGCRVCRR